jgi:cytochrome c oxidase subunit 2
MLERLLPLAGSAHARDLDAVLSSIHLHMALQGIAWGAFFVYCLVRFRSRGGPRATAQGLRPALPLVAIGLVVLGNAMLLVVTALPAWAKRSAMPDPQSSPLEVRIAAEQFAWNVHYPGPDGRFGVTRSALISASNPVGIDRTTADAQDDIGLLNTLTVPVGRAVIVQLSSRDVVHSFTLNEMRVRQDATPGTSVRTWFTPIVTGQWEIACSQLCGLGHYRMRGVFTVLPEADWQEWQRRELSLITPVRP